MFMFMFHERYSILFKKLLPEIVRTTLCSPKNVQCGIAPQLPQTLRLRPAQQQLLLPRLLHQRLTQLRHLRRLGF